MIVKHLILLWSWTCFARGGSFQKVQFLQPATSFTSRTDHFVSAAKIPKTPRRRVGIEDYFSIDLPPVYPSLEPWGHSLGFFDQNPLHFDDVHITPDFSDGLSYPDPFLRTGFEARRLASYLYSKELFFHEIPHARALLYNQKERRKNELQPHQLGSLNPTSPWYRYKGLSGFVGAHSVLQF